MRNIRSGRRQRFHLSIDQMNTMRQHHVGTRNAKRVEIGNVSQAALALDYLALTSIFGGVSMNHHPMFARQLGDLAQQLARATDGKPRRKAAANPATALAVPLL